MRLGRAGIDLKVEVLLFCVIFVFEGLFRNQCAVASWEFLDFGVAVQLASGHTRSKSPEKTWNFDTNLPHGIDTCG